METLNIPEHEKIFNEICHKLNELSQDEDQKNSKDRVVQLDKMQNQLKNFQIELVSNHEDMKLKIETLEKMTTSNSDLTMKVKELTDLLNQERNHNSKLSTDLARSLDLSLKLQLEIQEIKTKAIQAQMDDRKQYLENYENIQFDFQKEKGRLLEMNQGLAGEIKQKQEQIQMLEGKINELEAGMMEVEGHSQEQAETIKHLMTVAENKIVELKLDSDRIQSELDNVRGQFEQSKTQTEILKKENIALKDYINKMTAFQQQIFAAQGHPAQPGQQAQAQIAQR
ncbi:hypothetical protein [Pseudobdellovibrio sp. HCB154]|uniref:hypothetical protein n=1 Tax=Pseudobdellovibrio sp. HCB154 TaxID=3386277 RepID=UPI00391716EA